MDYIDHHAHMTSRTTDDYEQMALTGCRVLTEPAFWAGYDRGTPEAFVAYFEALTDFEPKRAAKYGIQHFTWLSLNPKEAEDRALCAAVLPIIEKYLGRPNVLGIGEIGLNRVTRNELATFEDHVELAIRHDHLPIMIHTPHLEDKLKGTRVILDSLASEQRIQPERVMVDHAEEHTLGTIKDQGYWAGLTLYPQTKVSPQRAAPTSTRPRAGRRSLPASSAMRRRSRRGSHQRLHLALACACLGSRVARSLKAATSIDLPIGCASRASTCSHSMGSRTVRSTARP